MGTVAADTTQGSDLFTGDQSFYAHDDQADSKTTAGVYSHNELQASANEAEAMCDWARHINGILSGFISAADTDFDTDDVLSTGIGAGYGILMVAESVDAVASAWLVQDESLLAMMVHGSFSGTKDTASKYNVYYETDQFKVQNKVGNNKSVVVRMLSMS